MADTDGRERATRFEIPGDLRLADVMTFLTVRRCESIAGAARELRVTPSQASKAVARVEEQLGFVLLRRSVHGVQLTQAALRILPHLEQMVEHLRRALAPDVPTAREVTLGAPSWLSAIGAPAIAETLGERRLRSVELPPAVLRSASSESAFDLLLLVGDARLPASWQSTSVGEIRKGLLGRPQLARALGPGPVSTARLREVPFIRPVYSLDREFVPVDDDCPLGPQDRRTGHETQTLVVALEIARRVDELVFGPLLAAARYVAAGELVEIPVAGWDIREPVLLACNTERVRANEYRRAVDALTQVLAPPPSEQPIAVAGPSRRR